MWENERFGKGMLMQAIRKSAAEGGPGSVELPLPWDGRGAEKPWKLL